MDIGVQFANERKRRMLKVSSWDVAAKKKMLERGTLYSMATSCEGQERFSGVVS